MAFPTGSVDTFGTDLIGTNAPAIAVGSNLYVIDWISGIQHVIAWKSTDAGVTWNFTPLGPLMGNGDLGFATVLVGSIIWVIANDHATSMISAIPYSTATDTWGTAVVSTIPAITLDFGYNVLLRPSDSAIIITYAQPSGPGGLMRAALTVFNGVAFSVPVAVGITGADINDCVNSSITIGPATEVEMLFWFGALQTSVSTVQGISRQPLNGSTVGALQNIFTDATPVSINNQPGAACDGITYIAVLANDAVRTRITVCIAPCSSFVFVNTDINSTGAMCVCAVPFQGPYGTTVLLGGDDEVCEYYDNQLVTPTLIGSFPNTPASIIPGNSADLSTTVVGFIWLDNAAGAIFFASFAPTGGPPPGPALLNAIINGSSLPVIPMPNNLRNCAPPKGPDSHGFSNCCK